VGLGRQAYVRPGANRQIVLGIMSPSTPFQWKSASLSDVGIVRKINEDACISLQDIGVWVVADGMGGHERGDLASRTLVDTVSDIKPAERLGELINRLRNRLQHANRLLREEGMRLGGSLVGTTVAALILHGRHAVCIWAGDSRVYRYRHRVLRQLTHDHRWVEEYVARGVMTREMADQHPLAHQITRAVGADDELELSMEFRDLAGCDKFLLCSDGLYGEVSLPDLSRLLELEDLGQACHAMVGLAKENGADDNVTVIVIEVTKAK
jgi:serine/threonine protein phosphatase PrpC